MAGDGKWLGSVNTTIIVVALAIGLSWVVAFILWGGVQKTSRLVHDYRLRKGWTKEKIPEEWLGGPRPMPDYVRNQKKPLVFAECGPRIAPRTLSIRSRRSVADLDPRWDEEYLKRRHSLPVQDHYLEPTLVDPNAPRATAPWYSVSEDDPRQTRDFSLPTFPPPTRDFTRPVHRTPTQDSVTARPLSARELVSGRHPTPPLNTDVRDFSQPAHPTPTRVSSRLSESPAPAHHGPRRDVNFSRPNANRPTSLPSADNSHLNPHIFEPQDLDANRPNAPSGTWRPLTPIDSSLAEPGPSRPGSIHVRNSHADPSASQSRGLHRNSDARFVRPPSGFRVASDYDEPSEVFQVNGVHYDRTPLPEKALDQLAQAKYMGLGVPTRRDSVLSVDSNGNPPAPESDERRRTRRVSFADTAKAQRPTEKRPPLNRWMTHDPDRRGSAPTQTMPNYPRENRPPSTGVVPHDPDRRGPASTQVMPRDPGRKGPVFTGVMPSGPTTRRPSPHRMMLNGPNGNRPPLNGMPRDPERGRPGSTQMTPDHPTTKHPPSTGMMSNGLNGTRPPPAGMMPHDPDRRVRASNGVMSNGPRGKQPASNGAVPHDPDRRRPSFIETRRPSFTETRPPDGSKRKRPEQAD